MEGPQVLLSFLLACCATRIKWNNTVAVLLSTLISVLVEISYLAKMHAICEQSPFGGALGLRCSRLLVSRASAGSGGCI